MFKKITKTIEKYRVIKGIDTYIIVCDYTEFYKYPFCKEKASFRTYPVSKTLVVIKDLLDYQLWGLCPEFRDKEDAEFHISKVLKLNKLN